ncbi:MAG: peptidoglycan editing factor PgeF [Desulfomonilaceae bacterium]|nr:peptidoglycan editing factor PgeF [Desulfomonilaceae bacterium]
MEELSRPTFPKTALGPNPDTAAVIGAAERINGVMAFTVRSSGPWAAANDTCSLDFRESQTNSGSHVTRNLEKLSTHLGIDAHGIVTCRQIHSDRIVVANGPSESVPSADAVITERPGIYPAVKTADCLPILILEPAKGIAAAVHAGRRGTVLRITRKVLTFMKKRYGCEPSDMIVALGPAIGACCYELDERVLTPLRQAIPHAERFIVAGSQDRSRKEGQTPSYRLDLTAVNRYELEAEGVPDKNIHELKLCTSCNPQLFFSYRRDGIHSGRQLSLAGFRP